MDNNYYSPYKIVSDLNTNDVSAYDYPLLKRKLLADYELNNDQPIIYNEVALNKSDALSILEQVRDEKTMKFHAVIFQDKMLLKALEKRNPVVLREHLGIHDPELRKFYGQYFTPIYAQALAKSLREHGNVQLFFRVKLSMFSDDLDDERVFGKAYTYAKTVVREISNINSQAHGDPINYQTLLKNFASQYVNGRLVHNLNALGDYFSDLRDKLAIECCNASYELNNNLKNHYLAFEYIRASHALEINTVEKELISSNYKIIRDNLNTVNGGSSADGGTSFSIKGIFWFIFILVKIGLLASRCS